MKKLLIALFILSLQTGVYSQKEKNIWYFGDNAGITFNTTDGEPVALTDSRMVTLEGCAVLSDTSGKLMFYTNGVDVWTKEHKTMLNGTGLHGNSYSTQSALIVADPKHDYYYYIFTQDCREIGTYGLQYSIVDMRQDSGRGEVVSKNNALLSNTTEKLAAVVHKNGKDTWVITHKWNSNGYYAFLVTGNGINTTPVVSNTGSIHEGNLWNYMGYLKSSQDGSRLVCCVFNEHLFELFNFDNSTGRVNNPISLSSPDFYAAYGAEFSPDGTKLYLSVDNPNNGESRVYWVDLLAGDANAMINSATIISSNNFRYGALQNGPNGRIYHARRGQGYLGVIKNPNASASLCNYVANGVNLSGKYCEWGLPSCTAGKYVKRGIKGNIVLCEGDTLILEPDFETSPGAQFWWTGPYGISDFNRQLVIKDIKPEMEGWYVLAVIENSDTTIDSIYVDVVPLPEVSIIPKGPITICSGDSAVLSARPIINRAVYEWSTGETGTQIVVKKSGRYMLVTTNESGCSDTDYVDVNVLPYPLPKINIKGSTGICKGDSTILCLDGELLPSYKFKWSTGQTDTQIVVKTGGIYYVDVENEYGCTARASIIVIVYTLENIKIKALGPTAFCKGSIVELSAYPCPDGYKFLWSTGDTTNKILCSENGRYWLYYSVGDGCRDSAYIDITVYGAEDAKVNFGEITHICRGDSVLLSARDSTGRYSYKWSTGETTSSIVVTKEGKYRLVVYNKINHCSDTVWTDVRFVHSSDLAIKGAETICRGDSTFLSASPVELGTEYYWSTGDTSSSIWASDEGLYAVISRDTINGCLDTASIEIRYYDKTDVKITGKNSFCTGDSSRLKASITDGRFKYKWSNGETWPEITVSQTGWYRLETTDNNGCRSIDSIYVTAFDKPVAKILPDKGTTICSADSIKLTASPSGSEYTYSWSTGESSPEITVKTSQSVILSVTNKNGCMDRDTIDITVLDNPEIKLNTGSKMTICLGDSAVISVLNDFSSYKWSTGETTKSIVVKDSGTYSVEVTNDNGCKKRISVKAEVIDSRPEMPDLLEFITYISENEARKDVKIVNKINDSLLIGNVYIKDNPQDFDITTSPALPARLGGNESINIGIQFNHPMPEDVSDSLVVEIMEPCRISYYTGLIVRNTGSVVWLPDTIGIIGDNDFRIPLRAKLKKDVSSVLSYKSIMGNDASIFLPKLFESDAGIEVISGMCNIPLEGRDFDLSAQETILTDVNGTILLSQKNKTPLIIKEFNWSNRFIPVEIVNGSLEIKGLCQQALSSIKLIDNMFLQLLPNPATDETSLEITTDRQEDVFLGIYDVRGNRLMSRTLTKKSGTETFRLNVEELSAGVYEAVVRSGSGVVTKTLVVVK